MSQLRPLFRRMLLATHASVLSSEASYERAIAANRMGRERDVLNASADEKAWLADQLTRLLAEDAAEAADTRHALPDRGDDLEPAEGDAFTAAYARVDHDRSPADVHHWLAPRSES